MNLFINDYWFLPDKKRTGKKIKEIREKKELSYNKFAESIGTNYKTLYSWESGNSMPGLNHLFNIKREHSIKLEDLILPNSKFIYASNLDEEGKKYFEDNKSSDEVGLNCYFMIFTSLDKKVITYEEYSKLYNDAYEEAPYGEPYVGECSYADIKFDSSEYPIPTQNYIIGDLITKFKIKKLLLLNEDFDVQYNLFSLSATSEDEYIKKIKQKYGNFYKNNLDSYTKNAILYDYYVNNLDDSNEKSRLFRLFTELLLFNNQEYQMQIVENLPPLYQEIAYNSILRINAIEFSYLVKSLEKKGCKKYKFCDDMDIVESTNSSDPIFKNSPNRCRQLNIYRIVTNSIVNKLHQLKYEEYLNERI